MNILYGHAVTLCHRLYGLFSDETIFTELKLPRQYDKTCTGTNKPCEFVRILSLTLKRTPFVGVVRDFAKVLFRFVSFLLNVPENNFSVMSGRIHRFLGITSTFGR